MNIERYTDEQYLGGGYFAPSEGETNYTIRLVQTRKSHKCTSVLADVHEIPSGTRALLEGVIFPGEGRKSNYLCLECAAEFLDTIV